MKKFIFIITFLMISTIITNAQIIDTAGNYFAYHQAKMKFFQQEADSNGLLYYQVDGWKPFIRDMLFMHGKYDATGDMTEYAKAVDEYYTSLTDYLPNTLPDWEYIGTDEIYPDFNGQTYTETVGQGNISCIWVDNNDIENMIVGGNRGSVWKTTDGGDNWNCISDSEPLMDGTRSIYVDSINTDSIYVVQGNSRYSNGLFSTTNGGLSWVRNKVYVPNISAFYYPSAREKNQPRKWIINPNNDSIMFLMTWGEVLRSIDKGNNWQILLSRDYDFWSYNQSFNDIEFDPVDPSIIYVSGPEVFRFTQDGDNIISITSNVLQWSQNTTEFYKVLIGTQPKFPNKIWFAVNSWQGNDALLYYDKSLDNYYLLKSDWDLLDEHKMQCEISPLNNDHLSIGGTDTYIYDHTSGNKYDISKYNIPTNWTHVDVRDAKYMDDGYGNEVLFFGNDGGVFRADPTDTITDWDWTYLANDGTNGIRNGHLHGFDCSNSSTDILYAGLQDMNSAINIDDQWYRILGGDGGPGTIDKTDPNYMYLSFFNSPAFIKKTSNMWNDYETLIITESYAYPPIVLSPADPNTLVVGDRCKIYIFDDVRNSNNHNTFTISDDSNGAGILNFEEIAVAESNDSIIFASTGRYWPGWAPQPDPLEKSLYKSNDGGNSWTDISDYIEAALMYQPITGIAINPWNENEVWLCFGTISSSTDPNLAKKVYHSVNGGTSWVPMANGLPEKIPANEIVYDKRGGRLYLATDVGVYYYSRINNIWYNITGIKPTTFIGQIRFNYPLNKMRLGTHGRGIWQTDIPCYGGDTIYITSDTAWSLPHHPYADIIIDDNSTLTITSKVFMAVEAKIIVKPGGKLILNGGTLTNACGDLWGGIEVWGYPLATQTDANQGVLEIYNNGTIENAETGIRIGAEGYSNKGGGIVRAYKFNLLNNETAVIFDDYLFQTNASYFWEGDFNFTDHLGGTGELSTFQFVYLSNVHHVEFEACNFTNNSNLDHEGTGIRSSNAIVDVKGHCSAYSGSDCIAWDNTYFENLEYGIDSRASNTTDYTDVRNTVFTDNYRGIYLSGITNARVTSNKFELNGTAASESYGLYLDECDQYWVEDNHFEKGTTENTHAGIGIYVNESGVQANEIYLNSFDYIEYCVIALGNNRDGRRPETGLVIRCNDYDNTLFDEVVVYDGMLAPPTDDGIAALQGANTLNPEEMAGNLFYYNNTVSGDYDDINNQSNHFYYYYSSNAGAYDVEPLDYTTGTVTIVPKATPQWIYENACPSNLESTGGGGSEGLRSSLSEAQAGIETTETILAALIDGGNTETLNTEVENSTPPETSEIYNELMVESPNLSEIVVESSIEKEDVLPNAMIRDVMVANPHTSTSLQLLERLDERTNPMPAWMKAQILAGRSIQSLKTELEGELATYRLQKARAINGLANLYKSDPEITNVNDSLLALYQADNSLHSRYMQAWLYLQDGQFQQGQNVMAAIPVNFDLSGYELTTYQNMNLLYTMVAGLMETGNGADSLNPAQIAQLHIIAGSETGFASVYARNLLLALHELDYQEPVTLPNNLKSTVAEAAYQEMLNAQSPSMLEVYPNPSKDFVIIGYQVNEESPAAIEIRDVSGKLLKTLNVKGHTDQVTVNTHNWKAGVYMLSLIVNEQLIETTKFTLVK